MKRNYFKQTLTALLLLCAAVVNAQGQNQFRCKVLSETNRTIEVLGATNNVGTVVIPETIINENTGIAYTVVSIGDGAFLDCDSLECVVLPQTVRRIGQSAFRRSTIKDIVMPDSLTYLGPNAFYGCGWLESIVIPEGIEVIQYSDYVLHGCLSLKNISIPLSLAKITSEIYCSSDLNIHIKNIAAWCNIVFTDVSDYRLEGNTNTNQILLARKKLYMNGEEITDLVIPEGITKINDYAFYRFNSLTSLTLPKSLKTLGRDVFHECKGLESLYISDLASYCELEIDSHTQPPMSYASKLYLNGSLLRGTLTIPEGVTKIATRSFMKCDGIRKVNFPKSLKEIHYAAFKDCLGLQNVVIPDSVTYLGGISFEGCTNLSEITIPASMRMIDKNSFNGCTALKAVHTSDVGAWCNIKFPSNESNPLYYAEKLYVNGEEPKLLIVPDSITEIKDFAFRSCKTIENVIIHDGVTKIGQDAFNECKKMVNVVIGENVTSIGQYAFCGCSLLKNIRIPASVTSLGECALGYLNADIIIEGPAKFGLVAFRGSKETLYLNADIPETTKDYRNPFYLNELKKVVIDGNAKVVGKNAFYNSTKLQEVVLGNSVQGVGFYAFQNCPNLKSVSLSSGIEYIDDLAFGGCDSIEYVMTSSDVPAEVYNDIFSDVAYANATLYVPVGSKDTYMSTDYWNKFAKVEEVTVGDADFNGVINNNDNSTIVDNILYTASKKPIEKFVCDVDADGRVDVADIISLVNRDNGTENVISAQNGTIEENMSGNIIYAEPIDIIAGIESDVVLHINGSESFSAAQLDVYSPENVSVSSLEGGYYTSVPNESENVDYVHKSAIQKDGALRILAYSNGNVNLNLDGKFILKVNVDKETAPGIYSLWINNAFFVGADASKRNIGNIEIKINVLESSAVEDVVEMQQNSNGELYDLSGRRIIKPTKGGIYIKDGKKFIGR